MKDKNLVNKLVEQFKNKSEELSNTYKDIKDYNIQEYFKKNNEENGYHSVESSFIFEGYILKLIYKINVSILIPKSTLELRIIFEDGKLPVEYSIYDIFNVINEQNFKCYTFPYIDSIFKLDRSINYLMETFHIYKCEIEKISKDEGMLRNLEENIDNQIFSLLNDRVFESKDADYLVRILELYYTIDTSRFTSEVYLLYLTGKYNKAIKRYSKLSKNITIYEERLIKYIIDNNIEGEIIPEELRTFEQARSLQTKGYMEILPMLLSWIVLSPFWYTIYYLIFYVAISFLSKGSIYVGGIEPMMLIMPAFITAIINSYFVRRIVYKVFFKKRYDQIIALDEVESSITTNNRMLKLFQFIIAAGIVFTLLSANTNIVFKEKGFIDNLNILSLKGKYIEYDMVDSLYKANGIINSFGHRVDNPTYVIVLKNKEQINLYFNMMYEDIKTNVVPIFTKNKIEIKEIDVVQDLDKVLKEQKDAK